MKRHFFLCFAVIGYLLGLVAVQWAIAVAAGWGIARLGATTADAIQAHRPRLPHDPELREIHFGDWELKSFREIEATDPERIRAYWETPGDVRPPGGESWHDTAARVNRAIDRLIAAHCGRNIVVVAHFGMILTQIQRADNLTAAQAFSHRIDNLSVTTIAIRPDGWALGHVNHNP